MDTALAVNAVNTWIGARLGKKRREHSQRTAELCRSLAPRHGLDPEQAYLAGLAHDLAKEMGDLDQHELAIRSRDRRLREGMIPIPEILIQERKLRHGPAAESVLRDEFGFHDEEILEAVAFHSSAAPGIGRLALLVYAADKIEPERCWIDRNFRHRCMEEGLEGMVLLILGRSLEGLTASGRAIAPASLSLYNSLRGKAP